MMKLYEEFRVTEDDQDKIIGLITTFYKSIPPEFSEKKEKVGLRYRIDVSQTQFHSQQTSLDRKYVGDDSVKRMLMIELEDLNESSDFSYHARKFYSKLGKELKEELQAICNNLFRE